MGVPDLGNTGDSNTGHVSESNVGARVCQSKGAVTWGTVYGGPVSDNYAEDGPLFQRRVVRSSFKPSETSSHSRSSLEHW